jgi:hypothetical protein
MYSYLLSQKRQDCKEKTMLFDVNKTHKKPLRSLRLCEKKTGDDSYMLANVTTDNLRLFALFAD